MKNNHSCPQLSHDYHCGFVAITGRPNVGKSTMINKLLGEKLSIITPKPQTTRQQIKGILTSENYQIVFMDTPGFLHPRYELQEKMLDYIRRSLNDADLILFMTDIRNFPTGEDQDLCQLLEKIKTPKIALLNKADLVSPETVTAKSGELEKLFFQKIYPLSALQMTDTTELINLITPFLPCSPPLYSGDELSDLPVKFFVQEIIREQIFIHFHEEIPYSSTVIVEKFDEYENKIVIYANVWLERHSQKVIFIGTRGEMIKKIRLKSEQEIYKILDKRIQLHLWVKIKPHWRKKKNALKEFGFR